MTDRKKPGVAFWATVVVVVLGLAAVMYPLSAGPISYMLKTGFLPASALPVARCVYAPLRWLYANGPESYRAADKWYMDLWRPRD